MKIKKYSASSMREALLQIKQELGEDAIILKSRKLPRKMFALNSQEEVEVTAALDESAGSDELSPLQMSSTAGVYNRSSRPTRPEPALPSYDHIPPRRTRSMPVVQEELQSLEPPPVVRAAVETVSKLQYMELKEDFRELKDLVKSILQTGESTAAGGFVGGWAILYKRLVDSEVRPDIARELIETIQQQKSALDSANEREFVEVLSDSFPVSGPIKLPKNRPYVVVFVGPTGAGKTTTIAKLAAHLAIDKKKAVSLITADTYRIAAIEQIRTFADIVNIGLHVVFSSEELQAALGACQKDDIVFVDTAGRSQRNSDHMRELEVLLEALKADEVHLVLSATTKDSDLMSVIEKYRGLGTNRLLFTKLDETVCCGNILNAVTRSSIPVSYFTTGQRVPDDIELAKPARYLQRLWEGRLL